MKVKKNKKETKNIKKWIIIILAIILLSSALVLLIFKDDIFKTKILGTTVKLVDLPEYTKNVKKSKIERIAILSQSTNFETEEKKDINKILDFIENIEGVIDDERTEYIGISSVVSNNYGIVLYYKDNTNTIITISPKEFAVADSRYYKNKHAYYTTLKKLLEELV